jgi:GTP1/OBG
MKQRNQEEATTSINTRSDMSTRFSFDSRRLILICVLLFASARRGVESFLLIRPSPSQHQATSIRLQTSTIIPSRRLVGEKKQYNLLKSTSTLLQVLSSEVYDADKQVKNKPSRSSQTILSSKATSSAAAADDPEWKFFDTARIHVTGGDGGSGCVAFRREKGEARGGPNGGRGGSGGSVVLVCDNGLNTLLPLHQRVHVRASKGRNGQGKNKDGICAHDVEIAVPPGTVVRDLVTQKLAGELRVHGERLVVARGGRGGRGNFAFKTPQRTAPKLAERGEPGVSHWLSIELRLLADVGFLGVPNAGKRYVVHKLTIVCVFVLFFFCKEGTFLECSSRKLTKQPRFPL